MLKNNGIRKYQGDYSPNKSAGNTFLNTPSGALTIDNTTTSGITYYHNGGTTIPTNNTANVTLIPTINTNSCPSSFGTQQSMMAMQNDVESLDQQYLDLQYNYLALIDNGNTPDFIEQIKTTWSSDAWSLRDQLIAESPYVSQKAILEAVSKNVMPNAMILELCLANPDATQDESFIDKLKEASQNELPDYLLEYIRENWDEKTVRSILESQMGEIAFEKNLIVNNLLREELLQEEHNQTNILGYIEQQSGVELKINQIELTISQENWQEANAILASNIIDENLKDALYVFEDFQEYINFRSSLNERKLSQLNSSEIQFLENLAIKNTRVGAYSRNILCFFYDICFDAPIEVSTSQKALVTKPTIEEILYTLDIYPNPANQFTSFSWEIFVPLKNCIYTVYDLNGIQKIRNEITQNKGVITIDTRHLKNGLYLINIENNNKSLQTLKFVVNNK